MCVARYAAMRQAHQVLPQVFAALLIPWNWSVVAMSRGILLASATTDGDRCASVSVVTVAESCAKRRVNSATWARYGDSTENCEAASGALRPQRSAAEESVKRANRAAQKRASCAARQNTQEQHEVIRDAPGSSASSLSHGNLMRLCDRNSSASTH